MFLIFSKIPDISLTAVKYPAWLRLLRPSSPKRRTRFVNHLWQNNAKKVSLPPVLVITRWNTWFEAALYHVENLDHYILFVDEEMQNGDMQQLRKLSALLHGEQVDKLQAELEFIAVHCECLIKLLKSLEA